MPSIWTYIFLVFTLCINHCVCKQYHRYTLFSSVPRNNKHLNFLQNMTTKFDVNFWRPPVTLDKPVEFVIAPENMSMFLRQADQFGVFLTVLSDDVSRTFERQTVKSYTQTKLDTFDWKGYFRLNDIYTWLQDLAIANPYEMKLISIGKSYENRDIMAVRIALNGSRTRSKVVIEGGIHAREWISPAFVTCLLHRILHASSDQKEIFRYIARNYEWYFVPVLNPDGYDYTFTVDRLWRKNRNKLGVDLNRNFGHGFGTFGDYTDKKSPTYGGATPFSERETQAMADFVRSISGLEVYLAFHSYGQYMIIPYADSKEHIENYREVRNLCSMSAVSLAKKYKTQYTVGTAYETLGYLVPGASGCWVKDELKTPYVVTYELRDKGKNGFALPPDQILPTCQETIDGLVPLLAPHTPRFLKIRKAIMGSSSGKFFDNLDNIIIVFNAIFIIVFSA